MRILSSIGILFVCFISGGATCARRDTTLNFPPPPVVWTETPSLHEVAAVVNRTQNIRQLSTNSASVDLLSMPAVPKLNATLNLERDRNFRMRASLPIVSGIAMDLGSNDEMFWFEVPEGMSKVLYYARHDRYRQQLNHAILPVDPTWLIDALGLAQIDPSSVVAGPVKRDDGKLEIRSTVAMPNGTYQRVYFINPQAGYVTDLFLEDPNGRLIAQSKATNHVFYDQVQCSLPHQVEINLSPAYGPPLVMRIDVGRYVVNQLLSGDPQLFTMPTTASQAVDLTTLSGGRSVVPVPTPAPKPAVSMPIDYRASVPSAYPLRGTY